MKLPIAAIGAALALSAPALAQTVTNVHPQGYFSGGLNGNKPTACLYLSTDQGKFTLPLPMSMTAPTLALEVAADTITHPTFGTLSFDTAEPDPAICPFPGWEAALTILRPGSP